MSLFRAEHLVRKFHSGAGIVCAVNDVSLNIEEGKFTILRGRSGSGKTTLINLLSTLDVPDSGKIYYGEAELTSMAPEKKDSLRRCDIGIVFQSVALIGEMTAYENIEFALRLAGIPLRKRDTLIQESLERVGLLKRMNQLPGELSGGEQQRVAIARAIAHKPRVIFADEPTAELDTVTAMSTVKMFRESIQGSGASIVMSTHDPALFEAADVIHTLQNGEIADG